MRNSAHVTIDLDDVLSAGGVAQAIAAWCQRSSDTCCGIVGPEFSTSGPGPGWTRHHDIYDYAREAFRSGATHYIDLDDGRMISLAEIGEGENVSDDDEIIDQEGCLCRVEEWTDGSVVRIECPSVDDAVAHPNAVAAMAASVVDYHHAESDTVAWKTLIGEHHSAKAAHATLHRDCTGCASQGGYSDASVYCWDNEDGWVIDATDE